MSLHCLRLSGTLLSFILPGALGCGAPPPDPGPTTTVASTQEAGWKDQIAAVRAGSTTEVVVNDQPVTPEQLKLLGEGCEALEILEITTIQPPPSDVDSAVLRALPALQRIRLGFEADDALLATLAGIKSLRAINLPDGAFTDAGLAELVSLPNLELLRFHSPHVTDAGMHSIAAMPSLRFLHLVNVPVTDEGISALHGMGQLESLYIDGGKCTDDGLRALLQALPELHFHRDQLHLPDDPHRHPHN